MTGRRLTNLPKRIYQKWDFMKSEEFFQYAGRLSPQTWAKMSGVICFFINGQSGDIPKSVKLSVSWL